MEIALSVMIGVLAGVLVEVRRIKKSQEETPVESEIIDSEEVKEN